jgi:glc operon protein GlcG
VSAPGAERRHTGEGAMNLIPTLTAADAERALAASLVAARTAGVAVTIVIVDAAGTLLALGRMDGARAYTVDLATRKARTSAAIGVGTTVLAALYAGKSPPSEMMTMPGGVPVLSDKQTAGAIGVSGAATEIDESIAAAGLAAIAA